MYILPDDMYFSRFLEVTKKITFCNSIILQYHLPASLNADFKRINNGFIIL